MARGKKQKAAAKRAFPSLSQPLTVVPQPEANAEQIQLARAEVLSRRSAQEEQYDRDTLEAVLRSTKIEVADTDLERAMTASLEFAEKERELTLLLELSAAVAHDAYEEGAGGGSSSAATHSALACKEVGRTLKVSLNGDTRRGSVTWMEHFTRGEKFAEIVRCVEHLFAPALTCGRFTLLYSDDDGDLCTLAETTMDDLLLLAPSGPLRLSALIAPEPSAAGLTHYPKPPPAAGTSRLESKDKSCLVVSASIATPPSSPRSQCTSEDSETNPYAEEFWTLVGSPSSSHECS